jgi:5-methylcytosine-specific restriction enzyme A
MPKLRSLGPLVRQADTRTARPPPSPISPQQRFKRADPFYASPEFRAWRAKVIDRARARCEAIEYGERCTRRHPSDRLFADHVVEIKDGGEPFDLNNGQCLCGPHHLMKTAQTRRDRLAGNRGGQKS